MFGYVDVKDVAAAHILAMQIPASNGERFALAEKDLWYKDVAKLLRENGFDKAPTLAIPVWLTKIMANFSKELKLTLPFLGRLRSINSSKAKNILGWSPRPAEESIVEIANQMKELGMIK
jgi:dihydroflavonol-4-reductase